MGTLVSTEWLSRHLDDPDLVVLDCTVNQVPEAGGGFHNVAVYTASLQERAADPANPMVVEGAEGAGRE